MRRAFFWLFFLVLLFVCTAALSIFLTQNSQTISLYFGAEWMGFYRSREVAVGHLVLLSLGAGLFLSSFVLTGNLLSKNFELRRLRREIEALQRTLELKEREKRTEPSAK